MGKRESLSPVQKEQAAEKKETDFVHAQGKCPLPLSCSPQPTNRAMTTADLRAPHIQDFMLELLCLPRIVMFLVPTSEELGSAFTNIF